MADLIDHDDQLIRRGDAKKAMSPMLRDMISRGKACHILDGVPAIAALTPAEAGGVEALAIGDMDQATLETIARYFDAIGDDAPLTGRECAKAVRGLMPTPAPVDALVKAARDLEEGLGCNGVNVGTLRLNLWRALNDYDAAIRECRK